MTRTSTLIPVLAVLLTGCMAGKGQRCTLDSDCKQGLLCWYYTNTCEDRCTQSSECDNGKLCLCEPGRECPEIDDDTSLEDVENGACMMPEISDADTDEIVEDTVVDTVIVDTLEDDAGMDVPDIPSDVECGSDGHPDVLPDGACVVPAEFASPTLIKTVFEVGVDGNPGSGLDLDDNPSTCSPADDPSIPEADCSAGIENALWGLGLLANDYLSASIASGELNILIELAGTMDDGCEFTMNFYKSTRVPSDPAACPDDTVCDYELDPDSWDAQCRALSTLPGGTMTGTRMETAVSTEPYLFTLVVVGLNFVIPLHEARFEGHFAPSAGGADLTGILGGYVVKDEFFAVLEAIPEEEYPPTPGKAGVIAIINQLYDNHTIVNDMDIDGDTVLDAASIGIKIEAEPATIVGIGS